MRPDTAWLSAVIAGLVLVAGVSSASFTSNGVRVAPVSLSVGTATPSDPVAATLNLTADADTELYQHSPDKNAGTLRQLNVISRQGWNARLLIRFDLAAVPDGATVTACTLNLFLTEPASQGSRQHGAFLLTAHGDWIEGTRRFSTAQDGASSWRWYARPELWDAAGGDMAATPTAVAETGTAKRVWRSWDVTPDCQPGQAISWVIRDLAEDNPFYTVRTEYQSRESFYPDEQPFLTVIYELPG